MSTNFVNVTVYPKLALTILLLRSRGVERRIHQSHPVALEHIYKAARLPLPIIALIEMRYRVDGERESFKQTLEGEISSLWEKVRESLPEEVAKLICQDESF